MNFKVFEIFLEAGIILSPIAALLAYIIIYIEYARHYQTKDKTRKIAFQFAKTAFIFFFVATLISGILISLVYS